MSCSSVFQSAVNETALVHLLGPIALYPDTLLTLVLTASAFPLQIVQADRWIVDNSDAVKQNDFTKVDSMPGIYRYRR